MMVVACLAGIASAEAEGVPESTPWNLEELRRIPAYEWGDTNPVRSLYYEGEPYNGQATRVFAYYATPGTLSEIITKEEGK